MFSHSIVRPRASLQPSVFSEPISSCPKVAVQIDPLAQMKGPRAPVDKAQVGATHVVPGLPRGAGSAGTPGSPPSDRLRVSPKSAWAPLGPAFGPLGVLCGCGRTWTSRSAGSVVGVVRRCSWAKGKRPLACGSHPECHPLADPARNVFLINVPVALQTPRVGLQMPHASDSHSET